MSMKSKTKQLRIAATLALNAIEEHLVGTYIDWHDVARVLREALNEMQKKKNGNTWNHYCPECKEEKK